ncbi:SIS domain-containing protein [Pseudoruegeria sp. SHC-113]|uniref:KpsF/GutQ family sugar-phosphate isomerase n=1 Tax=Pseudoruegeria sp. SHC-113 TaxID=2855439 RepID=UPI0021BA7903|nr:KpsF/GutQ family sugar-phosphate isomerase [Pseudoruegeria sp. SHC-113]MCT8160376.1 KpsF/GutQ family sugar-phosphate isomerase [Pseudoruegeria sp. SHC-113]
MTTDSDHVKQAITINREGIDALIAALDTPELSAATQAAVETVFAMKGRLIVTGLGKSGHIGSKLAATFASTGTPSFFVHPSEASHGDLGMIIGDDVILMLTWSGETKELSDIAAYSRRFGVPLILLTGNGESSLAKAADVVLALPKAREACPHNLAPTTSTMMQLAMGDGIAIALLQKKGFSETSFHRFHPGGKLGASLTRIADMMVPFEDLPLVRPDQPVIDVIAALSDKSFGIVGIIGSDGALQGVVTDGDIRRYLERQSDAPMQQAMRETFAETIMTRDPITLEPGRLSARALHTMQERRISAAFVVEAGKPVGLVTVLQLLNVGAA